MKPSRPSATSLLIAHGTVYLGGHQDYAPLVPLEAEAISESIVKAWAPLSYRLIAIFRRQRWFQNLIHALEDMTVPGMLLHYQLRKRQIEAWLHRLQREEGIERLVLFGAGMDTLGLRWAAEFPECQVVEVDHVDTQTAKVFGLRERVLPDNLHFIAADLSCDTWKAVREKLPTHHSQRPRTVFLAEGLFMYLPLSEVQSLLRECRQEQCAGFIFSFMEVDDAGRPAFRVQEEATDRWLKRNGETFVWGSSLEVMRQRLQHLGFKLSEKAEARDLQGRFKHLVQGKLRSAAGEIMVLCKES